MADMTTPEATKIQHILVPVDFSAPSDSAFDYAVTLAKTLGAALSAVHIYQSPVYALPDGVVFPSADLEAEISDAAQKELSQWESNHQPNNTKLQVHLRKGNPSNEIVRFAKEQNADLIVMGTHGRTGLERLMVGSVAERVVRTSNVPVLTVPAS